MALGTKDRFPTTGYPAWRRLSILVARRDTYGKQQAEEGTPRVSKENEAAREQATRIAEPEIFRTKGATVATNDVTSKPKGIGQYLTLAIVLIIGVAGIAVIGFYQEEVMGFFRLQAWNMGPVTNGTKEFLQAAKDGDDSKITPMLSFDPQSTKEIREGGKLVGFIIPIYGGTAKPKLAEFAADANTKITGPDISFADGWAMMDVKYSEKKTVRVMWKRRDGIWKIAQFAWITFP